jgi:tRNA pseudouridine55 synthase
MSFSDSGIIVIDKPQGITSHDVVAAVRKKLGTRKVGHAGTLDPMASGVLVIGVNQATRLLDFVVAGIKEYEATVRLGQSTVSDDADGEVVTTTDASHIDDETIVSVFSKFSGKISQVPSKVSAKKVDGKRAHALVREGVEFELKPKEVEIFECEIIDISRLDAFVDLRIRVKCSAGTYIRSIARDAGEMLAVGGHLTALRRTLVAPVDISIANSLDSDFQLVDFHLIDMFNATTKVLPFTQVSREVALEITFGKPLPSDLVDENGVSAIAFDSQIMAIVEKNESLELSYRAVLTNELGD